jgi:hypothetical protein
MDNNQGFNENMDNEEVFSPFSENVIERDYTRPNVQGQIDGNPIEEPVIIAPTFQDLESAFQKDLNGDNSPSMDTDGGEDSDWTPTANESMNELDNKEKKQASKAMVEAFLDGYSRLWDFANEKIKISPKKINKGIQEGDINPNLAIPVEGGSLPVLKFVDVYNRELEGVLSVDDEFKEKVKPVMQRVFMKRGIGMTDEQLLMYYFGMDAISKGATMYAITSQNKELIQSMKEMSQGYVPNTNENRTYQEPQKTEERVYQEPESVASTPTREYKEPEEKVKKAKPEYEEVEVISDEAEKPKKESGLPKFGDPDILAHMEQIANEGKPPTTTKGTRGRRKKQ